MNSKAVGASLPLLGIQVLDLTRLLPGPLATRHLADLGATVTKVEGPAVDGQQDGSRALFATPVEQAAGHPSQMFRTLNARKALLEIDLRGAAGRDALLAQACASDVLVEGYRPGVMGRLGLGWDVLHAANPRLVLCSISGYGQSGAWSQRAGHDINYIAMAGVLEQITTVQGEPALPNFQIGDLMGGTQAAVSAVLAALFAAQRDGLGRHLDISMTHELHRHHVLAAVAVAATGRMPEPGRELLSGGAPCYGVYRCADGRFMAAGALELKFWQGLCNTLARPEWAGRHWSLGLVPGSRESMALRDEVSAVFASRPMAHWARMFDGIDACVTPVLRLDELPGHPLYM